MADNVAITAGSGTTVATDDIGGVQYQRVKVALGADGTAVDAVAGAGVVGTGVQRTTLASDDPAVVALQIMDDWDETDRAKVNIIAGQAGVAAGAGAVGVTVQRMTLASDDPAVAVLGATADAASSGAASISAKLRFIAATGVPVTGTVNTIAGQTGVQGGSGAVSALTQRVSIATDDGVATNLTTIATTGSVNAANSSTANLSGAAAFTGTGVDTTNYAAIQVSVYSSHASGTNGLSLQQSSDNSNWDNVDTFTVSATTPMVIQIPTQMRYFRLVYTNGATLTTSLRIQTILKINAPRGSAQRPGDGLSNENDFEQNMAFAMIFNGTTWDRVRGTSGSMNVAITSGTSNLAASSTGGYTPYMLISAASTNATSLKASAGTVGSITISNVNAAARYLKLYNKASAPTVGTDVPVQVYVIPGNTAGAGSNIMLPPQGLNFSTGIAFALTTGIATSDTGAVSASEHAVSIGYA